jgi:hypothetical protein
MTYGSMMLFGSFFCSFASFSISKSISMTSSFAPPCSGPRREPIAAVSAEYMSESVEMTTRAVNVELFSP